MKSRNSGGSPDVMRQKPPARNATNHTSTTRRRCRRTERARRTRTTGRPLAVAGVTDDKPVLRSGMIPETHSVTTHFNLNDPAFSTQTRSGPATGAKGILRSADSKDATLRERRQGRARGGCARTGRRGIEVRSPAATLDHRVPLSFASCCPSFARLYPCSSRRTRQIGPASTPTSPQPLNKTLAIERSTCALIARVS